MILLACRIRCVPPSVTAQMKRIDTRVWPPRYFHDRRMDQELRTWHSLLRPYQPDAPIGGPVGLAIRLVYPHLKKTRVDDRSALVPKVSKPDAGNASKAIEDMLVKLRFIDDDQQVASLTVEKWHGPEARVGIEIEIRRLEARA